MDCFTLLTMTWESECWCWWSAGVISFVFMRKNRLLVVYGLLHFARNDEKELSLREFVELVAI